MIFAETGREESFDVLIVEATALFDHRFRQSGQRGEFAVLWQTTVTNGLHIRRIDPLLERQRRMERDGPCAGIGHRVGEQHDLDLRFREAAAVHIAEQSDEAVDQHRRCGHDSGDVRDHTESQLQLSECRLRRFGGGFNGVNRKVCHVSHPFI